MTSHKDAGAIAWQIPAKWDALAEKYYFHGYRADGKKKKRWLRQDEMLGNGQPDPDADPNQLEVIQRTGTQVMAQSIAKPQPQSFGNGSLEADYVFVDASFPGNYTTAIGNLGNHGNEFMTNEAGYKGKAREDWGNAYSDQGHLAIVEPTGTTDFSDPNLTYAMEEMTIEDAVEITQQIRSYTYSEYGARSGSGSSRPRNSIGESWHNHKPHSPSTAQPQSPSEAGGVHINKRSTKPYKPKYLDINYKVHQSHDFKPGRIFKVMWCEPKGIPFNGSKHPYGGGTKYTTLQKHRQEVWTGFRRFIIIKNDEGHCSCVPILTYGRQGCAKSGVHALKHGIVHSTNSEPNMVENEKPLGFDAVRAKMDNKEELTPDSRVNYSKIITVEHNVKVIFVGTVLWDDWSIVVTAVASCWKAGLTRHPNAPPAPTNSSYRPSAKDTFG